MYDGAAASSPLRHVALTCHRRVLFPAKPASSDRSLVFAEHRCLVLLNWHGLVDLKDCQAETARGTLQSLVPSEDGFFFKLHPGWAKRFSWDLLAVTER